MNKVKYIIGLLAICLLFVACSTENINVGTNSQGEVLEAEPVSLYTQREISNELSKQPVIITKEEYVVQDEEYKGIYPDALNVVVQNNSGSNINEMVIGFVAWDENNLPTKIRRKNSFKSEKYIEIKYDNINVSNGATYGEDSGVILSEKNNISRFKAIIVSYKDDSGKKWENPLLSKFKELFVEQEIK